MNSLLGRLIHVVLTFNAKDGAQAVLLKSLKWPDLLPAEDRGLSTLQECGNDDGSVYLNLRGEAEQMTLPYFL